MSAKRRTIERDVSGAARSGIHALPTFNGNAVNIVIETPKGARAKMKYDEEADVFRFEKLLPVGHAFPFDFGFLPATLGGDGDPLDVLLIGEEPAPVGCAGKDHWRSGRKADREREQRAKRSHHCRSSGREVPYANGACAAFRQSAGKSDYRFLRLL
jgi:hypothetical protein